VRDVPEARILIVEDEDAIMEIVSQALRRHGYETASASDGDAALEKIFSLRPDLVILDLMLPKMDGWEVCRRMRAEPETERIPILMLTARRDERDVVEGLELGADDYMKKPFSLAELTARVKALLRRTGERRESRIVENCAAARDADRSEPDGVPAPGSAGAEDGADCLTRGAAVEDMELLRRRYADRGRAYLPPAEEA
jgi:DNA-binding response OmpR family regulator